jgi:hypothetical protein
MATTKVAKAKINLPANIQQQLAAEAASITSRIGTPGGDRIKVTQKKTFRLPSGEESAGPIDAVIVDFVSANFLYDGAFDPNDITPPICAAIGTERTMLTPFEDATDRQCDTCSACPQNQWGSGRGQGKACQNTYLLALLPPDADAETPLMVLKVSPTAMKAFDGYVASIARSFQAPPLAVITQVSLDENVDYPSLRFGNPSPCSADLMSLVLSRREEARTRLTTKPDFAAAAEAAKTVKKATPSRRGNVR